MSQQIFFAHANGFPSATYGKLFAALAPDYQVQHLAQHAHDPRFPVDENWQSLVDELLHHLAQQDQPVWGVAKRLMTAIAPGTISLANHCSAISIPIASTRM